MLIKFANLIVLEWLFSHVLVLRSTTLTCGSGNNPFLQELTGVGVTATSGFLPSVLLLLLFLSSTALLSTGGGGKGLEAATLD